MDLFSARQQQQVSQPNSLALWLCWECEANITRFTKFKLRVKHAYQILHDLTAQITIPELAPKFSIQQVVNITLSPTSDSEPESAAETTVKTEKEHDSSTPSVKYETDYSDDDDKLLIDICSKDTTKPKVERTGKVKRNGKVKVKKKTCFQTQMQYMRLFVQLRSGVQLPSQATPQAVPVSDLQRELYQQAGGQEPLCGHALSKVTVRSATISGDTAGGTSVCSANCTSKLTVRNHCAAVHYQRYMCSDCGKKFASKTKLKDHVDWEHLKNFVHTCTDCQKRVAVQVRRVRRALLVAQLSVAPRAARASQRQTNLRSHIIALHTSESPYKCGACGARFSWHSCLSRHVRRVHSNAKSN
ncbi:Zinc finger protein 16 [Operophtera brumata]|uniref:Zinc finger protein 16 n=1 Tax=Operophtera brumata TaxID=104452 RepID=A0A0L7L977_OPEBR|nr:Zinc finger protein 16 [Operophtera brumata]